MTTRTGRLIRGAVLHGTLLISSFVMALPFIWMVLTSFKTTAESIQVPLKWIPEKKLFLGDSDTELVRTADQGVYEIRTGADRGKKVIAGIEGTEPVRERRLVWSNYVRAWKAAPFGLYFLNSILTSVVITVVQVLTSALAAYAFAKLAFPFKNALFMVLVATLMIPGQVLLIPNYIILSKLRLIDTYPALIVPWLASVFGIYFLRQHFETIPADLFDAAKIDGCTHGQTLRQVVLPLSQSVVLSTALLTFIANWNSLLWPLIVTNSPKMRTLQVGLAVFNQEAGTMWPLLMAASAFSLLPLVVLFFLTQKTFIEGVAGSGLKE
jgi:ABC-type glycerol-3-phosphate transport system permease component